MVPHTADTVDTANVTNTTNTVFAPPRYWELVLALYLAGIRIDTLGTTIMNLTRTVIQENLGVGDQASMWVFAIYTLAYAVEIPVIGKLVDLWGIKPAFLAAIGLLVVGSLGYGLSQTLESYGMLLASRVVQTLDEGRITPVVTAAVTIVVPPAKQGHTLGLIGMVHGATSVLGAEAGPLALAVTGAGN